MGIKERYCISEVADALHLKIHVSTNAARMRIYRGIMSGDIKAKSFAGAMRIEREEVKKIIDGVLL